MPDVDEGVVAGLLGVADAFDLADDAADD